MLLTELEGCVQLSEDDNCKWPPSSWSNVPSKCDVPNKRFSCSIHVLVSANLPSDVSVSYTHLDVYKRQFQTSIST